eukprot:4989853-Lingulodinium_polyedra.AAC.1
MHFGAHFAARLTSDELRNPFRIASCAGGRTAAEQRPKCGNLRCPGRCCDDCRLNATRNHVDAHAYSCVLVYMPACIR